MNIKKILYYGLIALLGVNGVFALLFYVFTLMFPVQKNTQTSTSTSQTVEISESTTTVSEITPEPTPEIQEEIPEPEVEVSIYDIPFGDGYEFPDLSEYDFVFIGDSIYDMYCSTTSMPRQLEVYTGSRVYNLSRVGSCAGSQSSGYISLTYITDVFLSGKPTGDEGNMSINRDIQKFTNDKHDSRKMVIVLNQCINDYLNATELSNPNDAYDITTYEGALRTSISKIKKEYPKATIVYMEPYYIGTYEQGTRINERGLNMDAYIASLEKVAGEYGVQCFNLRSYDYFSTYKDSYLLDDLLHPSDMCSKVMARLFCDYVQNNIK